MYFSPQLYRLSVFKYKITLQNVGTPLFSCSFAVHVHFPSFIRAVSPAHLPSGRASVGRKNQYDTWGAGFERGNSRVAPAPTEGTGPGCPGLRGALKHLHQDHFELMFDTNLFDTRSRKRNILHMRGRSPFTLFCQWMSNARTNWVRCFGLALRLKFLFPRFVWRGIELFCFKLAHGGFEFSRLLSFPLFCFSAFFHFLSKLFSFFFGRAWTSLFSRRISTANSAKSVLSFPFSIWLAASVLAFA